MMHQKFAFFQMKIDVLYEVIKSVNCTVVEDFQSLDFFYVSKEMGILLLADPFPSASSLPIIKFSTFYVSSAIRFCLTSQFFTSWRFVAYKKKRLWSILWCSVNENGVLVFKYIEIFISTSQVTVVRLIMPNVVLEPKQVNNPRSCCQANFQRIFAGNLR